MQPIRFDPNKVETTFHTPMEIETWGEKDEISLDQQIKNQLLEKGSLTFSLAELMARILGQHPLEVNKISSHVLKLTQKYSTNAAKHMLQDPLKAMIELIVNGFDASLPQDHSVGQFGIGFMGIFGFFDWEETQGITLLIDTQYRELENTIFRYQMKFSLNENQAIHVQFILTQPEGPHTGTKIQILPKEGEFSDQTLSKLREYCAALAYYPHGYLNLSIHQAQGIVSEKIGNPSSQIHVDMRLTSKEWMIQDRGTGITFEKAITKLLVASSSDKEKELPPLEKRLEQLKHLTILPEIIHSTDKNEKKSHFIITVNGVIVKNVQLPNVYHSDENLSVSLLLKLPYATINVGRDELLIQEYETQLLKKIIQNSIKKTFGQSEANGILLDILFTSLKAFENSMFSNMGSIFSSYLKQEVETFLKKNPHVVPLDHRFASPLTKMLKKYFPDVKIFSTPLSLINFDLSRLHQLLETLFITKNNQSPHRSILKLCASGQVLENVNVYFIEDELLPLSFNKKPYVTSMGLASVLFCPLSLFERLRENENFSQTLLAREIILHAAEDIQYLALPARMSNRAPDFFSESVGGPLIFASPTSNHVTDALRLLKKCVRTSKIDRVYFLQKVFESLSEETYQTIFKHLHQLFVADPAIILKLLATRKPLFWSVKDLLDYLKRRRESEINQTGEEDQKRAFYLNLKGLKRYVLDDNGSLKKFDFLKFIDSYLSNHMTIEGLKICLVECSFSPLVNFIFLAFLINHRLISLDKNLEEELRSSSIVNSGGTTVSADNLNGFIEDFENSIQNSRGAVYVGNELIWHENMKSLKAEQAITLLEILIRKTDENTFYHIMPELKTSSSILNLNLLKVINADSERIKYINSVLVRHSYLENVILRGSILRPNERQSTLSNILKELIFFATMEDEFSSKEDALTYGLLKKLRLAYIQIVLETIRPLESQKILTYGGNSSWQVYQRKSNCKDLFAGFRLLMEYFSNYTPMLHRMIQLNIDCWEYYLNQKKISAVLLPAINSLTPINDLVLLIETSGNDVNNGLDICRTIIEKARGWEEVSFIAKILSHYMQKNQDISWYQLNQSIGSFIDKYIHVYVPLHKVYEQTHSHSYLPNMKIEMNEELARGLKSLAFQKNDEIQTINHLTLPESLKNNQSVFTICQLIQAFMQVNPETIDDRSILNILSQAPLKKNDLEYFQRNKQSVLNGTERDDVAGTLIEWFQNSLDAIRSKKNEKMEDRNPQDIIFQVQLLRKKQVVLSISDPVGFHHLHSLLTFLIADYSEKTNQLDVVGKMGNGLSIMQRMAEKIIVKTRLRTSQKILNFIITPLKDSQGIYEDAQIQWCLEDERSDQAFIGTHIQLICLQQEPIDAWMKACYATEFLQHHMGAAPLELDHIGVFLKTPENLKLLSMKTRLSFSEKSHKIYRMEENKSSVCMIHGVPFLPLNIFCEQYSLVPPNLLNFMSTGWIVNLDPKVVKPKQSRTKAEILPEAILELLISLQQACFLSILYKIEKGEITNLHLFFPYWDTKLDVTQLGQVLLHERPHFMEEYRQAAQEKKNFNTQLFMTYFPAQEIFGELKGFAETLCEITEEVQTFYEENEAILNIHHSLTEQGNQALEKYLAGQLSEKEILNDFQQLNIKAKLSINNHLAAFLKSEFEVMEEAMNEGDFYEFPLEMAFIYMNKILKPFFETKIFSPPTLLNSLAHFISTSEIKEIDSVKDKIQSSTQDQLKKLENIALTFPLPLFIEKCVTVTRLILDHFFERYAHLVAPHLENPMSFLIFASNKPPAYFSNNGVYLNLCPQPFTILSTFLLGCLSEDINQTINSLKVWLNQTSLDGGVVFHELEHWRNQHASCSGVHGLCKSIYGKEMAFQSSAKQNSKEFIREGELSQWLSESKVLIERELTSNVHRDLQGLIKGMQMLIHETSLDEGFLLEPLFKSLPKE